MNTSLQFLKYNLHNRPFKTACSAIYFENLSGMSLILILLENDPVTPPPHKLLPKFEEYFSLSLMATSKLRIILSKTAAKTYSGCLPNELDIEYVYKN